MTLWLAAGLALVAGMAPCALLAARGGPLDRLVGLEAAGPLAATALMALAVGFGRDIYADVAVVFVLAQFVTTVGYLRLLERL
jgi:multisubunit Na+/H+ antiporter MnhF subunit